MNYRSGLLTVVMLTLLLAALPIFQPSARAQTNLTPVAPVTPTGDQVAGDLVNLTVQTAEGTANILDDFLNRLTRAPRSELVRILLVIGGVILLAMGWRIYDLIVVVAGFFIGASIAMSLVNTDNSLLLIGALLVGGLIGAALSTFLYYIAVFLIGAYIGILLTNALVAALTAATVISPWLLLFGGLIGGLVLLGLSFEFLALLSALVGAQMLSLGLGLGVVWTLIFAVIGVIVQLGLMRMNRTTFRRRPRPVFRRRAVFP